MFEKVPPIRLIIYTLIIGFFPILGTVFYYFSNQSTLTSLKERIAQMRYSALLQEQREASNQAVIAHFRDADHFYIDKNLETVSLLEPEIESLQRVTLKENYPGDETIQKRLEFLTGAPNSIAFTEGIVQSHPLYQETTETLSHSVEINVEDLKKLLSLIEGVQIGPFKPVENRPQLLVLDFKIEKKQQIEQNQIFQLNLKLLKREFL